MPDPCPPHDNSPRRILLCFTLMLVGLYLATAFAINLSKFHVTTTVNPSYHEALALRAGQLNLLTREPDTALYKDKFYSVHPPLFTIYTYVALRLGELQGLPPGEFYYPWYLLCAVLPLPLVGFWAFNQILRWPEWSAFLTANWLIATALLPTIQLSQDGSVNPLNHVLASTGLMLIAGDMLGRRRYGPAAIGLLIAGWSRPHTLLYALPVLWLAYRDHRRSAVITTAALLTFTAGTLAVLNILKFGNPFETGYRYIYDYRPQTYLGARFYAHGLFSPHFLWDNIKTLLFTVPHFRFSPEFITLERTEWGASFWITNPLVLALIPYARTWWKNPAAKGLFLASLGVIAFFLCYHSRGASSHGFHFYPLDFLPIWLTILAPWTATPKGRTITLLTFCYSALYFNFCCH